MPSRPLVTMVLVATVLASGYGTPRSAAAQVMPGPVYHDLAGKGHERLARRISRQLERRSAPQASDIVDLLSRWEREEGGPDSGWDWIAVTRLWLRAGDGERVRFALGEAETLGGVPTGTLRLARARLAWLEGRADSAALAYWQGCELADEGGSIDYWLDFEPLATPAEAEDWDRFRRLPLGQRDLCALLRRAWSRRAMAAALPVEARMQLHQDRLRYALDHYRRVGSKKGTTLSNKLGRPRDSAFDDRGLIYVRMGTPDRTTTFAGNTTLGQDAVSAECYQPNVSWAYDYPDGTRVFHLTSFGGTDDYWLIENLGLVYRCGDPATVIRGGAVGPLTPLEENRPVVLGPWAHLVLQDLYRSRQGLDSRYALMAQEMNDPSANVGGIDVPSVGSEALTSQRALQDEREWTWEDGEFAIAGVPDRPDVAGNVRMLFEELQFKALDSGASRVWLNGVVEAEQLSPVVEADGRLRYRVEARWALLNEQGIYFRFGADVETVTSRRLGRDESLPVRVLAELLPGRYEYNLLLRDASPSGEEAGRTGNYRRGDLTVRQFVAGTPSLSDIAVAADSGGAWSPGAGANLRASPTHHTGSDGIGYVYFEAYNLTPRGEYVTRVRLEPEGGDGETFDLSYPGEVDGNGRVTARVLRLDLSETPRGPYRMTVTIRDGSSGVETLPYGTHIAVNHGG